MGRIIPFSEFESYLESLTTHGEHKGAILDTNVLISANYDVRDSHSEVVELLEALQKLNYRVFATITTRSEYLEFQRRLALTENLLDLVDEFSKVRLPGQVKARIQAFKGHLKASSLADPNRDRVFNESQLKKIKKEFSAGPHSGQLGWLEVCKISLVEKLGYEDQALTELGIEYISPHDNSLNSFFAQKLEWQDAIRISERSGTAFSDAMILNVLKASHLQFVVTLDFDIGYAALCDPGMKDVVVPDRLFREYRTFHFPKGTP